jgi:hypothetical protein
MSALSYFSPRFPPPPDAGGLGGLRSNLDGLHGDIVRIKWTDLGRLGWRPDA